MDMDWTDMGIRTMEEPHNMCNWAPQNIVLVLVDKVLQYFVDNQRKIICLCYWIGKPTLGLRHFLLGFAPCASFPSSLLPSRAHVPKYHAIADSASAYVGGLTSRVQTLGGLVGVFCGL